MKAIASRIPWHKLLPQASRQDVLRALSLSALMVAFAPSAFAQHHDVPEHVGHGYSTHHYVPSGHSGYRQSYGHNQGQGDGGGYRVHGSRSQGFGGLVVGAHGVYSHDYAPSHAEYSQRSYYGGHVRHRSVYLSLFSLGH